MSDLKNNKVKIQNYDQFNLVVNLLLIPVVFFVGIYMAYGSWSDSIKATKAIDLSSSIDGSIIDLKVLDGENISESNRWYEEIIKIREAKLKKLQDWSSKKNTDLLKQYKEFYNLQISKLNDVDYPTIVTEIAGIANQVGVRIDGVSLGSHSVSKNLKFTKDSRYDIYERPVTFTFRKDEKGLTDLKDYDKLKEFLEKLRNDVKMPFNVAFEAGTTGDTSDIKFDKITLLFFYIVKK